MNLSKEKQKIFNNFKKCVDERSLDSMKSSLYNHLHLYASFIAHYDINGFRHTYSNFQFLDFVKHFTEPHYSFGINYRGEEYVEINQLNKLMQDYMLSNKDRIIYEFENKVIENKIKKLKLLASELGYDVVPKDVGVDLSTTIEDNGQLALF